ncbi:MAG: hypothetical protein ACAI44_39115 [Candidatus Sericytochromatia bacterium]
MSTVLLLVSLGLIASALPIAPTKGAGEVLLRTHFQSCTECPDMRLLEGEQEFKAQITDPKINKFSQIFIKGPLEAHFDFMRDGMSEDYWLVGKVIGHKSFEGEQWVYPELELRTVSYATFQFQGLLGILLGVMVLIGLGMSQLRAKAKQRRQNPAAEA